MRQHRIEGAGGTMLAVRDAGPEDAPALVLIHGWSQHSLCWSKQFEGALAGEFRLVAPDLRGHGASDRPPAPESYRDSALWAGDIRAVITALGLVRPVVVAWSMGGYVLADYLRHEGDGALAGVVFIGSGARTGAKADPAVMARRRSDAQALGMYSEDQAVALEAALNFVKACTAKPLSKRDLAMMVGYTMLVAPDIRKAARLRDEDYRPDLARLRVPALVVQGSAERICLPEMFEELVAAIPGARSVIYPGCGHAPFWESPERFNADLAEFARRCTAGSDADGTDGRAPAT